MADVSEKVVDHLESLEADEVLSRSSQVEKIDTVARRTFGLDSPVEGSGAVNLNVLSGGRAVVQVNQKKSRHQSKFTGVWHQFFPALVACAMDAKTLQTKDNNPFVSARQVGGLRVCPRFRPGRHSRRVARARRTLPRAHGGRQ